ncbi:MAG: PAS domain-containing protein [Bacteroidales bacterium]|nr:PAS domain-containing protein [Bacteroidales bacterium]
MPLIGIFTFLTLISGLIALILGIHVFRYRQSDYQITLSLLFFSVAWWDIATMFESISDTLKEHVLWVAITFPGMVLTPVFFFLFIFQYTHISHSVRSFSFLWLFLIPVVSCMIVWNPSWRDMIWQDVVLNHMPYGTVAHFKHGWWFYVLAYYSYFLVALGIFYLIRGLYLFPKRYNLQVRLLLFSSLLPLLFNIIYMIKSDYLSGLDLTPVALTMMTILFYFAISKHKLLKLRPVARDIVIENINEGVIVLDNRNVIIDCNRAAAKMLNQQDVYTVDSIPIYECFDMHSEFTAFLEDESREKDELLLPGYVFEITKKNISQNSGKISGKILVFHDITENKRKEKEITAINQQLKNANEVKDFLFKVVAHDLKGPIGNISALMNLLIDNREKDGHENGEMRIVNKALKNVHYMLENILHWTNSQYDTLSLNIEKHNLLNTVLSAWEVIRYQAKDKDIQAEFLGEEKILASYDDISMEIVFRNILSNAIKFSYKNSKIEVKVDADEENGYVRIADQGVGMSDKLIESTQKDLVVKSKSGTMKEKGTGIGLHMCHNLVRANKGRMDINSSVNKGTIVTISLPVNV